MIRTFVLADPSDRPILSDDERQRRYLTAMFCSMFIVPPSYVDVWVCSNDHVHVDIRDVGRYIYTIPSDDDGIYRFQNASCPNLVIAFPYL